MLVAALFVLVVAGNVFGESDFHRLPKITERSQSKTYTIFDPCATDKPDNRSVSCAQLRRQGENYTDQYDLSLQQKVRVTCDMKTDGGGWTLIQRRGQFENDVQIFLKSEKDYEKEFGEAQTSYWIGNENIHRLTAFPSNKQVLRIELWRTANESIVVEYGRFAVGSKDEKYKLSIGEYKGPDGYDGLSSHDEAPFTTRESGSRNSDCYRLRSGGWWFTDYTCGHSNLNGRKFKKSDPENLKGFGITWYNRSNPTSYNNVYRKVEMKVRDADFEFCMGFLTYNVLGFIPSP